MMDKFLEALKGLNDPKKMEAVKIITKDYENGCATIPNFYQHQNNRKKTKEGLYDKIETTDRYLNWLVEEENLSPYSIFLEILKEQYSDITIHHKGIRLSTSIKREEMIVDDDLYDTFNFFLEHFVNNIKFISNAKLDPGNAIIDQEINGLRFNVTHSSLNSDNHHVIIIRKPLVKKTMIFSDKEYLKSIGCNTKQEETIHKYAKKGNFIIFGEVGSGKSTLLNYMANYDLKNKNNLCAIQDVNELELNVPISMITNRRYKIKDLFTSALRQNPSSIIIGETRTDEIVDILEAALTISVGTTLHANSFPRAIQRIAFMSMSRKIEPMDMISLVSAAVDCFIFMEELKVKEIWEHGANIDENIFKVYHQVV